MKKRIFIIICMFLTIFSLIGCQLNQSMDIIPTEITTSIIATELLETIPPESTIPVIEETIPQTTEPLVFSENITYTIEFVEGTKDFMPYFIYIPSTIEDSSEPIPLIIWLHGGDEYYCKMELMQKRGLPAALEKMEEFEKFNAYILCPQWTRTGVRNWQYAGWHNEGVRAGLDLVLADVISKHNINTEKIIISGHSMGGRGAICNALHNKNDFEYYKVATVSGFLDNMDMPYIKDLNIRFYTGMPATGEYSGIYSYNTRTMTELFGEENLFIVEGSHGNSPVAAFLLDEDSNNRSDLIEWMLS